MRAEMNMKMKAVQKIYTTPETRLVVLQGVRGVMQDEDINGGTLSGSGTHGQAPARIPAQKLYL